MPSAEGCRDVIQTVVSGFAADVLSRITALRGQLDQLENIVLGNAAKVSGTLNEHVVLLNSVGQETARLTRIVAELRRIEETPRAS